jgi:hypothetical protein
VVFGSSWQYAVENEKFRSLVESWASSLAIGAGVSFPSSEAKFISKAVVREVRRMKSSYNDKSIDKQFIHKAIEDVCGIIVKGNCPACAVPLEALSH